MLIYPVEYWKMNWALDQLKRWNALALGAFKDEVGKVHKLQRRGRAWWVVDEPWNAEQLAAVEAKAALALHYKTATGVHILMLVPSQPTLAAKQELIAKVEKEMSSARPIRY